MALIAPIRTVRVPITELTEPGSDTEPVTTSPAFTFALSMDAVTTGRLSTVLTVSVLLLLLLSEALLVAGTVEDIPPAPGATTGLVVEAEIVTAGSRTDCLIIIVRAVLD